MSQRSNSSSGSTDALLIFAMVVTAIGFGVGAWLYVALWLSLLLEGRLASLPAPGPDTFSNLFGGLVQHPAQPWLRVAPAVSGAIFWPAAVGLLAALAAAVHAVLSRFDGSSLSRITRRGRDSHGESRWATPGDTRRLGRTAKAESLHPDGIVLGWWSRKVLQTPAEDNALVFGVQRSGKTSTVVVPTLLGWCGAAVATSTKEELVRLTGHHRASVGPVWVFAPLDSDHEWISDLGLTPAIWNPVAETSDPSRAVEIADLFTSDGKRGESAHWYHAASSLLAGLLLVGNTEGGDLRAVLARLNSLSQGEYVGLAKAHGGTTAGELLTAFANTPDREAGSIASTARSALSLWLDPRVEHATSAEADPRTNLDLGHLLETGGTLYLVAPAEEAERCRPLFSALLQSLLAAATRRARRQGGVLAPRLLLALDEVANFARMPRLGGYTSTGPGQGIQLLLCFHDLAQLEEGYGPEQARTVWNNCRARLLLPGQGDLRTLEHFSRGIGDETRTFEVPSWNNDGRSSTSTQRLGRPLATPDALRRMRQPVLLYGSSAPAQLTSRRWDEVPAWRSLVLPFEAPVRPSPRELINRARRGDWRGPGWSSVSSTLGKVTRRVIG